MSHWEENKIKRLKEGQKGSKREGREESCGFFLPLHLSTHITIPKAHPSQATGLSPPWMISGEEPCTGTKEN